MNSDWRLTVAEALKRPLFRHAVVIAGRGGLHRSVRWVHILETPENHVFLNGGELILSTGVGFGSDSEKRLAYLQGVMERGAVGVCIELGQYIRQIPTDMCEFADYHQFPLIAFQQPVRFVDITLDLHERIVNRHTEVLRRLEAYTRDLQQLSLQPNGLTRILQRLQATVQMQTVYYPLEGAPLFVPAMPQSVQTELVELLQQSASAGRLSQRNDGLLAISDKKTIIYQPITAMGHVLAYVGIILYERTADEFLLLTLDYTASAIAQILLRKMVAEERTRDKQDALLDQLLQGGSLSEEQLRLLLGIDSWENPPLYLAAIMEIGQERPAVLADGSPLFTDLLSLFRVLLKRCGFRPLLRSRGQRLYLLLLVERADNLREKMEKAIGEVNEIIRKGLGGDQTIFWGISRVSNRYETASRHFHEAEQAIFSHNWASSPFYSDLGVFRLLLSPQDRYTQRSFVDDYLGPLIRYDKQHNSQLVTTLRLFLDHHANKQEAAEKLFIRRQTLYHRLEKIKELLGDSYLLPEHRLCLEMALRIHEQLGGDG
ncbi:PucR family transcriptional regulator ligand-binding domain-containing protein [Brevibacillus humidisoli]|uniref:PucR family transcriptional regulator n=1 Tax=Brevibacillus humidisoli TaxID=2895522 RepID=UPI001E42A0C7|nr:PucR family transcriptional regulator [Brevibacillus humidisoli]UFJ42298.1 PucR family transcriptional regulator ligand-binding domain-containing protein [Brevibacillus humidisoli]